MTHFDEKFGILDVFYPQRTFIRTLSRSMLEVLYTDESYLATICRYAGKGCSGDSSGGCRQANFLYLDLFPPTRISQNICALTNIDIDAFQEQRLFGTQCNAMC